MDENLKIPKISVVMPVYNGENYLTEAIDSILSQTFTDFELLIINDGSSDRSEQIIQSYPDDRIVYIKNEKNIGLIKTLNKGLDLAKGEYIARMDQDDISHPERFSRQVALLEENLEIGVCGTWFTLFSENGKDRVIKHPESHKSIKIGLIIKSLIGHPTVMMRKNAMNNYRYDVNYQAAEDYELWTRLIRITKFHNIQESLLQYRLHDTNMTVLENSTQVANTKIITANQLKEIEIEGNSENIDLCHILLEAPSKFLYTVDELKKLVDFANILENKNLQKKIFDKKKLHQIISKRLMEAFNKTVNQNFSTLIFLLKNRKEIILERSMINNTKTLAKIILKK